MNPLNRKARFQSSGPRVIPYRYIKVMEKHRGLNMKVYEKTLEKRLRDIVKIDEKQFGFQSGKSTVDAIFVLQQLQEKFGAKKKVFPCLC